MPHDKTPQQYVHSMVDQIKWTEHDKPLIVFGVVDEDKPPFVFLAGPPNDLKEALARLMHIVCSTPESDLAEDADLSMN